MPDNKPRLWYLATPYSLYAKDVGPPGLGQAFNQACRVAARLIEAGIPIFSPIAHTHPIAMLGRLDPLDHALWMALDAPMMVAATGLLVVRMPGWTESKGITMEVAHFTAAHKPVAYMDPGATTIELDGVEMPFETFNLIST